MPISGVTFYLRGNSLTPRYAKGVKRYGVNQGAASFNNAAPSSPVSVISDAGAIGGQAIDLGNPTGSQSMIFPGYENIPSTLNFSAIMRCKIFSTSSPGLWGIGFLGGGNATAAPSIGVGFNGPNTRNRFVTPAGPGASANYYEDFSYATNPPDFTGSSYNDLVWLVERSSGTAKFKFYVNNVLVTSINFTQTFNTAIDVNQWPMIGLGLNNIFNTIDAYVSEFALIEGLINPGSIELESGTGALNGSARSSFLNIIEYSGVSFPLVSKTRNDQTWNEFGVAKTGTLALPSTGNVKKDIQYGDAGNGSTGTLESTDPGVANVVAPTEYKIESVSKVGTYVPPSSTDPGVGNVAAGVDYTINDVDLVGELFIGAFYDSLRGFLNYILDFVGTASLTNDEFDSITLDNPDFEYNEETYLALIPIIEARGEDISGTKDRLKKMFESAGVQVDEPAPSDNESEILFGGGVSDADTEAGGYNNILYGGSIED